MASMSILDDAIREHLELKRQHGADESELKKLEDEAFGPPSRPDGSNSSAEAPTEFLAAEVPAAAGPAEDEGRRRINVADLQEPPPPETKAPEVEISETSEPPRAEDSPVAPAEDPAQVAPPAEEEPPAVEPEAVTEPPAEAEPTAQSEPEADASHSTEERHAIAEQPTELFDVEGEIASEEEPPADVPSPTDEEIVEAEAAEPKLTPAEPATEIHASRSDVTEEPPAEPTEPVSEEYDDDFFSEQRLSDELDQALEAPLTDEDEDEEHDDKPEPESGHEDVLEDTPDFLEDAPEDDELWFEQRPPKDFDFDD
jgi:hypothetical protein